MFDAAAYYCAVLLLLRCPTATAQSYCYCAVLLLLRCPTATALSYYCLDAAAADT